MNKTYIFIIFVALIVAGYLVYKKTGQPIGPAAADEKPSVPKGAVTVPDGTYAIDSTASTVNWEARKPLLANYIDRGTLGIASGALTASAGSGSGVIRFDMNTIAVQATGKGIPGAGLERHLKSPDFFSVEAFPKAEFTITAIEPTGERFAYTVRGDLMIKGITNPVTFPATIYQLDGIVRARATVILDRTKWDIRYGSGKFFENLGDKIIDDLFTVRLDIAAR